MSSGTPTPAGTQYVLLTDASSTTATPLGFVAIDVSNLISSASTGSLDHVNGTVSGGLLAGTINAARTRVTLTGGATATLTNPENALHSRIFSTSGLPNDGFGVVGQFTDINDIPLSGSSTYDGSVQLQADNGDATFALIGDARITARWNATNTVDTTFSNLSGTKNDIESVQNVGTVTITDATLRDATFSGGTLTTTGSDLTYSGGGTLVAQGQFFGRDATEAGGVFGLTKPNEIEISGVYIAKGGID